MLDQRSPNGQGTQVRGMLVSPRSTHKGQFLAVPTPTGLSYGTQSRQQAHRMVQVQVRIKFGDQVVALVQF